MNPIPCFSCHICSEHTPLQPCSTAAQQLLNLQSYRLHSHARASAVTSIESRAQYICEPQPRHSCMITHHASHQQGTPFKIVIRSISKVLKRQLQHTMCTYSCGIIPAQTTMSMSCLRDMQYLYACKTAQAICGVGTSMLTSALARGRTTIACRRRFLQFCSRTCCTRACLTHLGHAATGLQ